MHFTSFRLIDTDKNMYFFHSSQREYYLINI